MNEADKQALKIWWEATGGGSAGEAIQAKQAWQAALEYARQPAEPVAWYRPSEEGYDSDYRDHRTVISCRGNPWTGWVPLYTTPQPAPEVCADQSIWCRYIAGLICTYLNDSSHEKAITRIIERRLWNLPERKPAPDVRELVDALGDLIDLYDGKKHEGISIVANGRAALAKHGGV